MRWSLFAWIDLSASTIKNCSNHTKILANTATVDISSDEIKNMEKENETYGKERALEQDLKTKLKQLPLRNLIDVEELPPR